jgi:hypothetical protein
MGLLDAGAGVVGAVLDQEFDRTAKDTAGLVDLRDGPFRAFDLADRQSGQTAGDRVDEADLEWGFAPRLANSRISLLLFVFTYLHMLQ